MKVFLIILAVILLLFLLFMFLKVKLRILSSDSIRVKAGVGPFMITVYPEKNIKIKLSDFTAKKYERLTKPRKEKISETNEMSSEKKNKFSDTVDLVKEIIKKANEYTDRIETKITRLNVTVGGEDSASAAIKYGFVSQGVTYMIELLDCKTKLSSHSKKTVSVVCDYMTDDISVDADIVVKIRIRHLLRAVISFLTDKFNFRK